MMTSNTPKGFSLAVTEEEKAVIEQVNGADTRYVLRQLAPNEFALVPSDRGAVFNSYAGRDGHVWLLRTVQIPAVLRTKHWSLTAVKEGQAVKNKVKFTPDTSRPFIERKAKTYHQSPVDATGKAYPEAVSLPEFRGAVDIVNRFVTENEGHVVLDIKTGLLKFLVEG